MTETNSIQVKICGITRMEDAMACVEADVNALGFIFFPKSPRNVSIEQAGGIIRNLPPHIDAVGVFVNASYASIMEKVDQCGLTAVQLHGQEPPAMVEQLLNQKIKVVKALFAKTEPGFEAARDYAPTAFLVECGKGVLPGGNAMQWNWGQAAEIPRQKPLILAGGLSAENVVEAVALAHPDAVDVSSCVEASPGIKDADKIKNFVHSIPKGYSALKVF